MSMYIAANTPVYMIIGHGGGTGAGGGGGGGGGGTFVFVTNGSSTNQSPALNLSSSVVAVIAAAGGRGGFFTSQVSSYSPGTLVTNATFTSATMSTVINKYQTSTTNCVPSAANGSSTGTAGGIYGLNCGAFGNFTNGSFVGSNGIDGGGYGGFGGGAGGNEFLSGPAAGLCAQPPIVSYQILGAGTEVYALSGYGFPMSSNVPTSGTTGYPGSATISFVSSGTAGTGGWPGYNGGNGQITIT